MKKDGCILIPLLLWQPVRVFYGIGERRPCGRGKAGNEGSAAYGSVRYEGVV